MNVLLLTSVFVFALVAVLYWFMPYVTPRSIQFGVRIPRERESDPAIASVRRGFHTRLAIGSVFLFIILIILPAIYAVYFLSLLSLLGELVFAFLIYFMSFRKLRKIKDSGKWYGIAEVAVTAVYETEPAKSGTLSAILAILPSIAVIAATIYVGISVYPSLPAQIPTHFGANGTANQFSAKSIGSVFLLVFVQIAMTVMMALIGYAIYRTRQEIDVSRPITTSDQQERFRLYTRDSLYLFNAMTNLTMMFAAMDTWQILPKGFSIEFLITPVLAGSLVLVVVLMSIGQMGSRLDVPGEATEDTGKINRNDDKYWIAGSIYYNRNDPSILVGKRFGVGWTFNFAHPITWVVLGALVSLPFIIVLLALFHII